MTDAFTAVFTNTCLVFLLCIAFALSGPRRNAPWAGTLPVLGGSEPPTHAWSRFHLRYYPMTLLFIAFEMEMMFMYPWAVVFVREGAKALMEMGMFLGILSLGILYAWREGALRWQ
jgi:NADH-quinone oxidoreductase subunit A